MSSEAFADEVAKVAEMLQPAAILPGGETGMLALSRYADRLPATVVLAAGDLATVARATDKTALPELARSAGLATPPTFALSADEAERGVPVELPAVIKPVRSQMIDARGFRGFGVRCVRTRAEAATALRELPDERGLIQHYFDGELCGLAGVFWDGALVTAVHQRAVRTWPLGCGEMSFAVATPRDTDLEHAAGRMLAELGWSGLFQLQFLDTADGRMLIDLNPRVYGSLALALGVGQNLAGIWADAVTGRGRPRDVSYRSGVRFRNEFLDTRALLAACTSPPYRRSRGDTTPRGEPTVNAFYDRSDPGPLMAVPRMVAAKLKRRAPRGRPISARFSS